MRSAAYWPRGNSGCGPARHCPSAGASWRPRDNHGGQARGALPDCERLPRETLDRLQGGPLAVIAKRNGDPGRARPARAADAMDVVVGVDRQIEVHHVRNIVDIQPAGGDVGGHQHQRLRRLEAEQHPLPGRLALVAVKGVGLRCRL